MEPARQTLEVGYLLKTRNMAISAAMVLPEPVGAPSRTFVSVWYSVWKIWVWMGLKWVNLYRPSYARLPRAVTGNGCRSSSSERESMMGGDDHKTTFMTAKSGLHQQKNTVCMSRTLTEGDTSCKTNVLYKHFTFIPIKMLSPQLSKTA